MDCLGCASYEEIDELRGTCTCEKSIFCGLTISPEHTCSVFHALAGGLWLLPHDAVPPSVAPRLTTSRS